MTKRVLILAAHFISIYLTRRELIEELTVRGCEVYIAMPDSQDNRFFTNLGCIIFPVKVDRRGTNPFKDIFTIIRYRRIIKKVDPDVILSYEIKPNLYGAFAAKWLKRPNTGERYKQICNVTGTGAVFLDDDIVSKLCKMLYRMSVKDAYLVFFQNAHDREFFINNKMVGDNTALLPGSGVNLNQYTPAPYPRDDETRFIFIARVMRVKGLLEYLDAAKKICKKYSGVKFYIAGFCEEEKYLRITEEYEKRGFVQYLGFRKDIMEWIEKCHCTVLPSRGGEGVPNVLLEAAAMARPVIGSRIPGTVDVIDDGVNGFLFEATDSEDLAAVMKKFLALSRDEQEKMGLLGREKVEKKFNRFDVVDRYLSEIEKL